MRTLLIDTDVLVYSSAFGAQKTRYTLETDCGEQLTFENSKLCKEFVKEKGFEEDTYKITPWLDLLDEHIALKIAENNLNNVKTAIAGASRFELYLTGKGNYREQVAVSAVYKGNRKADKPVHYQAVKDWFLNSAGAILCEGQEADDMLGIRSTELGSQGIICTIDKDLNQVIGLHYDWDKDLKYKVNKAQGDRFFCQQLLSGDATDNIPALAGIGTKTAMKILDGLSGKEMFDKVRETYEHKGKDDTYLTEQGRLLWIRRKRNELWDIKSFEESL